MRDAFGVERSDVSKRDERSVLHRDTRRKTGIFRGDKYDNVYDAGVLTGLGASVYPAWKLSGRGPLGTAAGMGTMVAGGIAGGAATTPIRRRMVANDRKKKVAKAWKGEQGDKRNTKYVLAGALGAGAGEYTGRHIGAKVAGSSVRTITQDARASAQEASAKHIANRPWDANSPMRMYKVARKAAKSSPGFKAVNRGAMAGNLIGGAAAMGGYAAYRHNKAKTA